MCNLYTFMELCRHISTQLQFKHKSISRIMLSMGRDAETFFHTCILKLTNSRTLGKDPT
uniref:Uncharacterized protein n=1 Tax=Rhizophora mucronata TaxID=61149 RepID=A0A2P2NRA1_RHIMU